MNGTLAIATSGLQVQLNRLGASANNVANSSSAGVTPDHTGTVPAGGPSAYQPTEAVSVAATSGATTVYRPLTPSSLLQYQPDSSLANSDGMVAVPNVDLGQEALTRVSANRAYQANLAVVKTSDLMVQSLLKMTT